MNLLTTIVVALVVLWFFGFIGGEEFYGFPARMYQPIRSLPAYQGGFGTPIDNINAVPQLREIEKTLYCGRYGNDSIGNLKLTSQHSNLIKNIN